MKISVIIPVYNGEKTLKKCLESVLQQEPRVEYEVVVVDNNSTDKTKEIIKEFDSVIYTFEPKRSRGAARNKGIEVAKGDIIAMTDSDCVVPRDWLYNITKPIVEGKEDCVMGGEKIIGNDYITRQRNKYVNKLRKKIAGHFDAKNSAIKKEMFKKIGLFDPEIINIEDVDMAMKLNRNNKKILFLEDCVVLHNHPLSLLGWMKLCSERAILMEKIFDKNGNIVYSRMNWKEFFLFFYQAPCSLLLEKEKERIFFEIMTGFAFRWGIIKYKI